MKMQFTALKKMFTRKMEEIIDYRMQVIVNLQTEAMNQKIDQIQEDNARPQSQVADFIKEVCSTVSAKICKEP